MATRTLTGRTLGHHVVLEKLGEGGMGVVYKGRDLRLERTVALKVLPPQTFVDEGSRRRFAREARTASSLNHPNIITIYEIDRADDVDFIAMEFVEGRTLCEVIADRRVSTLERLRIASQIVDALVAAHAAGIVHRDLKPSNVMVIPDGRVKVLDFGLARSAVQSGHAMESAATDSASGAIVGTAPYMSPEQAAGRPVDARSDIFSFGCLLYELLGGRRAFDGESLVHVLAAIVRDTPKPISGLTPGLARIIDRCLAKNPEERFRNAADLGTALAAADTPEPARPASIAVLPLANLGGRGEDDYLCEGLAEAIIGALSAVEGLRVIARTSAFAVARQGLDAPEIGTRLGVAHVLEGSVRRSGDRVRVSVRLVNAADGAEEWSERYDHDSPDVFALEDAIGSAVCRRLRGEAHGSRVGRTRAGVDPAARQAYLEGRYHFSRGGTGIVRAKSCFERALAIEPAFALACDSLAEVHWFFGFYGLMPPRDAFSQSTWLALRALELDESLGETHALLGMLRKELDYNWPEVHREMQRAIELNAPSPSVLVRNAISGMMPLGRLDEAERVLTAALDVDPLSLDVRWWLGCVNWLARRPEHAVAIGRGMIELDAASPLGHSMLAMGLSECGEVEEAVTAMRRAFEASGAAAFLLGFVGQFQARAGDRDAARETLKLLLQGDTGRYLPPFSVALVHIGLAEWDEAFAWMDRAIDERDPIIMPIKTFPFLDSVRSDPRYETLLRKMNLA